MGESKLLIGVVLVFGALAAMWWFGFFRPVTNMFQQIKKNAVVAPR
jgi:hypothetical protein